jgi:hypothetical protein
MDPPHPDRVCRAPTHLQRQASGLRSVHAARSTLLQALYFQENEQKSPVRRPVSHMLAIGNFVLLGQARRMPPSFSLCGTLLTSLFRSPDGAPTRSRWAPATFNDHCATANARIAIPTRWISPRGLEESIRTANPRGDSNNFRRDGVLPV